jgi:hypothetical protein
MKKLLVFILILTMLFTVVVNAETSDETYYEPVLKFTSGSVSNVVYDVAYDALTEQIYIHLETEKFGTCIYDDPSTSYIDGIRINDLTVDSLKIPIDPSKENTIVIRTVYKEDFTGTLAQMQDGVYDYSNLLKNPVGLLMFGYYALACILVIASIIGLLTGKKKKVKTADETAKAVDIHAQTAMSNLTTGILGEVRTALTPFFTKMTDTQDNIIKSLVLMNSKDPNAHLEALTSLKTVSNAEVAQILDGIVNSLQQNIVANNTHAEHNIKDLTEIAEATQEGSDNEKVTDLPIL